MIELEQLQHLITFQECETLSKAAKQLHISQPVLTRSMQKLEEELEVNNRSHSAKLRVARKVRK